MDLTVKQAAEQLNVSTKTIYRAIQSGVLPVMRIGGGKDIRIDADDFTLYRASLKSRKPYTRRGV